MAQRRSSPLRIIAFTLAITAGTLAALPEIISIGMRHWMVSQGLSDAYLVDVDFNLFNGKLRLDGVYGRKQDHPELGLLLGDADLAWLPLLQRRVVLSNLRVDGLQLTLTQDGEGRLVLNGLPLTAREDKPSAQRSGWHVGLEQALVTDSRITLALPHFRQTVDVSRLSISGLQTWDPAQPASVQLQLAMGDASVDVDAIVYPFARPKRLDSKLRVAALPLASLAKDLQAHLPAEWHLSSGRLDVDLAVRGRLDGSGGSLSPRGTVRLSDVELSTPQGQLGFNDLKWQGDITWNPQDGARSRGILNTEELHVQAAGHAMELKRVQWDGAAGWHAERGADADGALALDALELRRPQRQLQLAKLEHLDLERLQLSKDLALQLETLTLTGAVLLVPPGEQQPPLLQADRLILRSAIMNRTDGLGLGELLAENAKAHLTLDTDGTPRAARLLDLSVDTAPAPDQQAATSLVDDKTPRLAWAGVTVSGDSAVHFEDLSVSPPFNQRIDIDRLTLGAADAAKPELATPFELRGRLGEYGSVQLAGNARPFGDKLNLSLKGNVNALALPPLSSYSAPTLGYDLQSGQLNSELEVNIVDDRLDGKTRLVLNRLAVKKADTAATIALAMPLESALNVLRDSDDNIRLNLPVKGNINNPDFDLSDIINKAVGKALKTAAVSYIKFALQPYGTLITLAEMAGKASKGGALSPLHFQANEAALAGDSPDYIDKLAGLLKERPGMQLRLCGLATEEDRRAMAALLAAKSTRQEDSGEAGAAAALPDSALLSLAQARAEAVKRQLVHLGVAQERLLICKPEVDEAADGQPRVRVLL